MDEPNTTSNDIATAEPQAKITALLMGAASLVVGENYGTRGKVERIVNFGQSSFMVHFKSPRYVYIVPSRAVKIIELEMPNVNK